MSGTIRERTTPEIPTVVLGTVVLGVGVAGMLDAVGIGQLVVRVPANVAVRAHGRSGIGNVRVLGCEASGVGADRECETDGYPQAEEQVSLELEVGIGQIEVRR